MAPWMLLAVMGTFTPTDAYQSQEIGGFTVLIAPEAREHPEELATALDELSQQIDSIHKVLPVETLKKLQPTRIWLEWEARPRGAAEFHVSEGYLAKNGYNPEKKYAVEICNLRNFTKWSRQDQPWMVLHELAHAYHHTVLGVDHERITKLYQSACDSQTYDVVERAGAKPQKHYALTTRDEYFAELSEAYFGKNDFYPFVRAELQLHDPAGYAMIEELWGLPSTPAPAKK